MSLNTNNSSTQLTTTSPVSQINKLCGIGDLGKEFCGIHHIFGNDIHRRNNLHLLENNIIAYATGSSVIIANLLTNERKYLLSLDEGGIGCITIHPTKKYIAVGCRGYQPNIYIYEYPSLNVIKILRGGAERGYSCMTFNSTGDTLASVASSPDYMLTLWLWYDEKILLHSKAFGQEIYNVRFSEYNPSSLTTSGTGHIRFWKMASTFTGKKLQGSIGKFGKVELSDIAAFVELPDGKVCSGTESGAMLLWEGNFIKCRFVCPGNTLCHVGEITSIEIDHIKGCIVTAGLDGYMKWWDLEVIDTAEVDSDHSMDFTIQPLSETLITSDPLSGIRSILYHHKTLTPDTYELLRDNSSSSSTDIDTMYFLETSGNLKVIKSPSTSNYGLPQEYKIEIINSSHGSEITSLDCSPIGYVAVTGGMDGRLIFWDIRGRIEIASKHFESPITSLSWIPIHIDPTGQSICVGFQDGICKVLRLNRDVQISNKDLPSYTITQTMVMKPHNAAITHISFSNSSQLLVTAGKDGILFFFHCKQKYINGQLSMYTPLRFIRLRKNLNENTNLMASASNTALTTTTTTPSSSTLPAATATATASTTNKASLILCTSLSWSGSCLLIGCSDGIAREIDSELIIASTNEEAESYESNCQLREITLKVAPPTTSSSTSTTALEAKDSSANDEDSTAILPVNGKILRCVYSFAFDNTQHDKYYAAVMANYSANSNTSLLGSGGSSSTSTTTTSSSSSSQSSTQSFYSLQEASFQSDLSLKEYNYGCYDNTSKDLRNIPQITCMKYSISREFLVFGLIDGTVSLLPVNHLLTYITLPIHNMTGGGVSCVSLSYDNKFLLSTGYDGLLVIYRLKPLNILEKAQYLSNDITNGIYHTNSSSSSKTKSMTQLLDHTVPSYYVSSLINLSNFPALYDSTYQSEHPEYALEDIIKILPEIEEISDLPSNSYSIEDAKLKQEEDNKKSAADIKKDKIRVIINKLRKEFDELKYHNSQLPEVIQLTSNELLVDREYFQQLHSEQEKIITEIHLECEYMMEKSIKLKEKLYQRLMNDLLVEEMPLYGLRQKKPPKVYSLRTIGLSPEMNELLLHYSLQIKKEEEILSKAKIDAILASELDNAGNNNNNTSSSNAAAGGTGAGGGTTGRSLNRGDSFQSVDSLLHGAGGSTSKGNNSITKGLTKTTKIHLGPTRRELRLQRIDKIQSHLSKKPNENDDDERDIQAINYAIKTIGNYSLKSSDTYEVPEDQIINAEKKKRQIIMLQEAMITLRLQFNERFLLLRKLKIEIIENMKSYNSRIQQINHELDIMEMVNATSGTNTTVVSGSGGGGRSTSSQMNSPVPSSSTTSGGGGGIKIKYSNEIIWQPELKAEEFPDDREEITMEEIQEYQQQRATKEWSKVIPSKHHIYTGNKTIIEGNNPIPIKGKYLLAKSSLTRNPFFPSRNNIRLTSEEIDGKVQLSTIEDSSSSSSSSSTSTTSYYIKDTVLCFKGVDKLSSSLNHTKLESSIPVLSHIKSCTQQARYLTEKQISLTLKQLNNNPNTATKPSSSTSTTSLTSSDDKKLMNEYRRQLIFEKQFLQQKISDYIENFDSNIEDLRHDRHLLICNLKLSELKLLTYIQEYNLLLTFEEKDNYLKLKYIKYKNEKLDLEQLIQDIQIKLDYKLEDYNLYQEKLNNLYETYRNMIPGQESNQYYEILTKIYKKKIKRIKNNLENDGNNNLDDDEDMIDSDEDGDDDDEYDDEDIEDICPNGCDVTLYDQIITLREKKLDIDEILNDLQKTIDELKKSKERYKQREKQIDKDLKLSENEIQNFQRQKQSALNKIEVYIPLKISQIHAFTTSGVLSGPSNMEQEQGNNATATGTGAGTNDTMNIVVDGVDTMSIGSDSGTANGNGNATPTGGAGAGAGAGGDGQGGSTVPMTHEEKILMNVNKRSLVADMDMTSHTVFKTTNLERLSQRISELKIEISDAKNSLKSLHKEKIRLEKERNVQKEKIELWTEKCHELQMLKFGRLIDLDVLEAGSDRTKEKEGEIAITEQEMIHQAEMKKLLNEYEALKSEYAEITRINTEYLQSIAALTDRKLQISHEMNAHSSSNDAVNQEDATGGMNDYKDNIEKEKLTTFIRLQAREIESLKNEITMLRRKETAQFASLLPAAPPPIQSPAIPESSTAGTNKLNKNFTLPPIPNPKSHP